jgi:hypothetical protein
MKTNQKTFDPTDPPLDLLGKLQDIGLSMREIKWCCNRSEGSMAKLKDLVWSVKFTWMMLNGFSGELVPDPLAEIRMD